MLQRLSSVTGGVYGKTYTYRDTSTTNTTTQVAGLTYDLPTDITYGYTYDVLGNIATYTQGGTTYTYTYDAQNQLLKQVGGGKTYTYTYDAAGNILTSSDGTTSHSYTYGNSAWRDLLTAVDGHAISYETGSGNPTSYYNGTSWTFGWAEGRRLTSASGGGKSISYTYDSEGLRLSKKVGTTEHKYYYAGGKLMRETWGSNTLDFFYDAMGTPYAIKYNGTLYYYITNLQGDILHIVNTSGTPVVSYTYSPYGKVLSTTGTLASTLGADNPLRYRSYYYDTDSGLYYLQSRYYDPELCRFLNADSYTSTGQGILGCNMFAYCNNNPANFKDTCGTVPCHTTLDIKDRDGSYIVYSNIASTPQNQISGAINGQALLPYADSPIGFGTYGISGCQYIAVYNAMQLIGKPQSLASVTNEIFSYGAVAWGLFGAGPWAAANYFSAHDVDYVGSFSADTLVADISEGSVIVFTTWSSSGWHAMTALYINGKYMVFNRFNSEEKTLPYESLSEVYTNGGWIYGLRIDP